MMPAITEMGILYTTTTKRGKIKKGIAITTRKTETSTLPLLEAR